MTSSNPHNPEPEVIQFIGLNDISVEDQDTVKVLSGEYFDKIKRLANDLTNVVVHVKFHQKEGGKKKYALNVKVIIPGNIFESNNQDSWELPAAVHMSFDSILNQINHKLRTDTSRPN